MRKINYIILLNIALLIMFSYSSIADIDSLNREQDIESDQNTLKLHAADVCGREIQRKMPRFIILEDHCDVQKRKQYSLQLYIIEEKGGYAKPLGERDYCSYSPKVIESSKDGYKLVFHVETLNDYKKSGLFVMKNIYIINCLVNSSGDDPIIEDNGKCYFNCK